jgi:hypothetical protein
MEPAVVWKNDFIQHREYYIEIDMSKFLKQYDKPSYKLSELKSKDNIKFIGTFKEITRGKQKYKSVDEIMNDFFGHINVKKINWNNLMSQEEQTQSMQELHSMSVFEREEFGIVKLVFTNIKQVINNKTENVGINNLNIPLCDVGTIYKIFKKNPTIMFHSILGDDNTKNVEDYMYSSSGGKTRKRRIKRKER